MSLHGSAALDPTSGWATTAADTVTLLQAIWTGRVARVLIDELRSARGIIP
jgi:hypothetical protein